MARRNHVQLEMARTLYGEARGEGEVGMQAVANVIVNRSLLGGFGTGIIGVVKKPKQFSAWNKDDRNYPLIRALKPGAGNYTFDLAYEIAGKAINSNLPDITGGADHYHTNRVNPSWNRRMRKTTEIGRHIFWKA